MSYLKWLNPLNWGTLALQIVGGLLALSLLGWYANYKLSNYYTAVQKQEVQNAKLKADAAIARREAENAKIYKEATDAKNKALEANLAAATAADQSRAGLLDSVRASEDRAKTDHATCLQHARALGEVFDTGTELLGRIAKEADGHTADKIACHAAWPK